MNGGFDLYGQYYPSRRDAENAELAQCAEIDARLAYKKIDELEKRLQYQQPEPSSNEDQIHYLWEKIKELEAKIDTINQQLSDLNK